MLLEFYITSFWKYITTSIESRLGKGIFKFILYFNIIFPFTGFFMVMKHLQEFQSLILIYSHQKFFFYLLIIYDSDFTANNQENVMMNISDIVSPRPFRYWSIIKRGLWNNALPLVHRTLFKWNLRRYQMKNLFCWICLPHDDCFVFSIHLNIQLELKRDFSKSINGDKTSIWLTTVC